MVRRDPPQMRQPFQAASSLAKGTSKLVNSSLDWLQARVGDVAGSPLAQQVPLLYSRYRSQKVPEP